MDCWRTGAPGSRDVAPVPNPGSKPPATSDLQEVLVSLPLEDTNAPPVVAPTASIQSGVPATRGPGSISPSRGPAVATVGMSPPPRPATSPSPLLLDGQASARLDPDPDRGLDPDPGSTDERSALLSAWQRSDQAPNAPAQPATRTAPPPPPHVAAGARSTGAATAGVVSGPGAATSTGTAGGAGPPAGKSTPLGFGSRGTPASAVGPGGWPGGSGGGGKAGVLPRMAPFEMAGPAALGGSSSRAGLLAPVGHSDSPTSGGGRGPGRMQAERQSSALLRAATAAGDLHSAVPELQAHLAPPAPSAGGPTAIAAVAAAARADGGGGGGLSGSGVLPGFKSDLDDGSQQLHEYLRDEQLRHASETRSCMLSPTGWKRVFMLSVTGGFLGLAIYLSTIPWGQQERAALPTWRWFLLVGCLPSVWYIPWFTIFLVVLLLESLLPVAVAGSSGLRRSGGQGGGAAGADSGAPGGLHQGGSMGGPALVIYHILGVRRHMVRVLRSLCGQLLVHYAVVDYLDPQEQSREGNLMKAWTCLTLFLTANTLKSLIAKALSKHFHSRGYLERMQQAVKQELVLMALSRPRPGRTSSDALTHPGLGYHLAHIFGYSASGSATLGALTLGRGAGASAAGGKAAAGGRGGGGGGGGGGTAYGTGTAISTASGMRSPFAALAAGEAGGAGGGGTTAVAAEGRRSADRRLCHSSGDQLAMGQGRPEVAKNPASQQQQQQGRQPYQQRGAPGLGRDDEPSVRGGGRAKGSGDGSVRAGTAAYGRSGGGGGGARAGSGASGTIPATATATAKCTAASHLRTGPRSFWGWLAVHMRVTYSKTKVQWELSRPSNSSNPPSAHRRVAVNSPGGPLSPGGGNAFGAASSGGMRSGGAGGPGEGLVGTGSLAGGGGGAGVGPNGLNYEQLRTSLFWLEQHIRRNKLRMGVTLTDQLRAAAEGGEEGNEVTSKTEAKRLAFYLHMNVLGLSDLKGRKYLVARDFEPFFNSAEDVREAFAVFDSDRDGRITLQNMVDTIVRIYKERKKLSLTLQDTRTVVAKLELICGVVLHVLFGFSYLVIFQVNVRELWLTFSSVTLAFVFVFGNSIRNIYEAVLFLFVVHPFDVGDWLVLANGEMVKVEEIAMLFCTFLRGDGHRLYYPNSKLMTEPVINVSRSDTFWDSVTILVDVATPGSVVEAVEYRLKRWLADNNKQYTGSGGVLARALASPAKLQLTATWEYCHTGEDGSRTARWRSKAILVLAAALEATGTSYTLPSIKDSRLGRDTAAVVGLMATDGFPGAGDGGGLGGGLGAGRVGEGGVGQGRVQLTSGTAMIMQGGS